MRDYKYKGEMFKLDDSKGCYVEVTYKGLTGYVGVNIGNNRGDVHPYVWFRDKGFVTPDGMTNGNSNGTSLEDNLIAMCRSLLRSVQTEEAAAAFNAEESCEKLHKAVNNLPL